MTDPAVMVCTSCGARLAHDHADTICSPCRRSLIENAAHREALFARDSALIRRIFESSGVYAVAERLDCAPAEALDVLIRLRVLVTSPRQRGLLRQLVELRGSSHVEAARALNISRWTVATYRRQLGIDRAPAAAGHEVSGLR